MRRARTKAAAIAGCASLLLALTAALHALRPRPAADVAPLEPAGLQMAAASAPALEPARIPTPRRAAELVPAPATVPPSPRVPEAAVAALRAGSLSRPEVEQIYAFLDSNGVPSGMTPMMLHALKNDLLNLLRDLPQPPDDLTQEMIRLYRDFSQDTVIRIYALQHLGLWYDQITGAPLSGERAARPARTSSEAADILVILRAALGERHEGVAGTALLAYYHLLPAHPELDEKAIAEVALEMARDENCDPFTRTSAIQVCGGLGLQQARSLAVRLAVRAPTVPLQTAAIAALGDLGGENERRLLVQLADSGGPRLRLACQSALKRIAKRIPSPGERG